MAFDALLGNDQLKHRLCESLRRGRPSHFYLIAGPKGSGRHTLARLLAAALMCQGDAPPCGRCEGCRKVLAGVHPDFITVEDPDHKTVPVDLIRRVRADAFIQPNEGRRKIYLFPQELRLEGQNALLKLLEEPPGYGAFLLIAEDPQTLLPTIRSRCAELRLQPLPEDLLRRELRQRFPQADDQALDTAIARGGGFLGQAQDLLSGAAALLPQTTDFLASFCRRDSLGLLQVLVPMEKWKRDALVEALQQWISLLEEALACRTTGRGLTRQVRDLAAQRSPQDLLQAIGRLQKCVTYAQGNISPAAICGYLEWALR